MKNCIVIGRIVPERANVRFGPVQFQFNHSETRGSGSAFAEFSQLSVRLSLESDCSNHYHITSIARSAAAPISNYIAFTQTAAYHIVFDLILDVDDQRHYPISVAEPFFSEEAREAPNTFLRKKQHDLVEIPASVFDSTMQRALDELANALRYPQLSPMYCRLAIETLRNSFDPNDEANAWRLLRDGLNVRRDTIDSFWKLAADQRHGRIVEHTWDDRKSCLRTTWEIVNRFTLRSADPAIQFDPI